MSKKKKLVISFIFFIISVLAGYEVSRFRGYIFSQIGMPTKMPQGFRRISVEKKIPPEKDWYFIVTYENTKKQQIIFNYEPQRPLFCDGGFWQKNLSVFKPKGSSKGCSFYLDVYKNNKPVQLHWFLWNRGDKTYSIYDHESILTDKEAMTVANSVGQQLVIAQDLTNAK